MRDLFNVRQPKRYVWLAKGRIHYAMISQTERHLVGVTPEGRTYSGDTPEEIMDVIGGVFGHRVEQTEAA